MWKPPSKLDFDGAPVNIAVRRFKEKNLPEHLARPPIDEETLLRLKTMSRTKTSGEGRGPTKKMSLGAQKADKAEAKRKGLMLELDNVMNQYEKAEVEKVMLIKKIQVLKSLQEGSDGGGAEAEASARESEQSGHYKGGRCGECGQRGGGRGG